MSRISIYASYKASTRAVVRSYHKHLQTSKYLWKLPEITALGRAVANLAVDVGDVQVGLEAAEVTTDPNLAVLTNVHLVVPNEGRKAVEKPVHVDRRGVALIVCIAHHVGDIGERILAETFLENPSFFGLDPLVGELSSLVAVNAVGQLARSNLVEVAVRGKLVRNEQDIRVEPPVRHDVEHRLVLALDDRSNKKQNIHSKWSLLSK